MRILIDFADGRFLPGLAAPPVRIGDEEHLVLGEILQTREQLRRAGLLELLPRGERGAQAARIGDILAQSEFAVHVQGLGVRAGDGEFMKLVDEALRLGLEGRDCFVVPPFGEIPGLVEVPSR